MLGSKPFETLVSALKKSFDGIVRNGSSGKEFRERRRCRRTEVDLSVSFWCENMEQRTARLINMCRDGLFIETDVKLERGQVIKVKLPAIGSQQFPGISIGTIVRRNPRGVAIRWR